MATPVKELPQQTDCGGKTWLTWELSQGPGPAPATGASPLSIRLLAPDGGCSGTSGLMPLPPRTPCPMDRITSNRKPPQITLS